MSSSEKQENSKELKQEIKKLVIEEVKRRRQQGKYNPPLLEPWVIALIVICSIIGLILVGYLLFLFVMWCKNNAKKLPDATVTKGPATSQKICQTANGKHLSPKEEAWIQLGLGPALGLSQGPRIRQVQGRLPLTASGPRINQVQSPRINQVQSPRINQVQSPRINQVQSPRINQVQGPRRNQVHSVS